MVYLFLSATIFAIVALIYKYANQAGCDSISIIAAERISAVFFITLFMLFFDKFQPSTAVTFLGFAGGITIFISRLALLLSLKYGKISSSWTAVNLSVVIPTIASIFFWKEIPGIRQLIGLLLVPLAIYLLQEKEKD